MMAPRRNISQAPQDINHFIIFKTPQQLLQLQLHANHRRRPTYLPRRYLIFLGLYQKDTHVTVVFICKLTAETSLLNSSNKVSEQTGIALYFCDPHRCRQRGYNKNMNGLLRQYLPKGTYLSIYSQEQLDAIADEINNRPRKGLGVRSPLAVYSDLLINNPQHSTLIH